MNKIIDIVRKIACLFLSAILFFVICFYLMIELIPKLIVKDNVQILLNEIATETLIYNGENSFVEELNSEVLKINQEHDLLSEMINKDNFKGIISTYYAEMTEAILYNKKAPKLNSKALVKIMRKNFEDLIGNSDMSISLEEKTQIMEYIDSNADRIVEIVPTTSELFAQIGQENIDALRTLVGPLLKIIIIIIMLIIVSFVALVSWSSYKFAAWSGGTTVVAGVTVMLLPSFLYDVALNYMTITISAPIKNLIENNILKTITTTGTVTIAIGAIQILYYFLMKKRKEKY